MTKLIVVDTFSDFISAAANFGDADKRHPQRVGQRLFNLLDTVRPDLGAMVCDSDFDPFTDDSRLPLFYDFVMRHWDDDKETV